MDSKFYVRREVAMLLKKNGYPQKGTDFYWDSSNTSSPSLVAVPTFAEVCEWFRKKGILISIEWFINEFDNKEDKSVFWKSQAFINEHIEYSENEKTPYDAINDLFIKILN